jgi:hypothetical protein
MYFASDLPNVTRVTQELARRIGAAPALSWYALVDGAFDYDAGGPPLAGFTQRAPTYDCDEFNALLAASPYLVALSASDYATLLAQITTLVRHRRNRPMLSFIGSAVSAADLNTNFQHYASAATQDGESYMLRFADTRILPAIAAHLHPASWRGISQSIRAWHYIDRNGAVDEVAVSGDEAQATVPPAPFALSDAEFAALVGAGEPDAVIHALERSNPELLPEQDHALFYDQVAAACRFASTHRIDAFPDIVAIVTYTIVAGPAALAQGEFIRLIEGASWQRGQLIDAIVLFAGDTV